MGELIKLKLQMRYRNQYSSLREWLVRKVNLTGKSIFMIDLILRLFIGGGIFLTINFLILENVSYPIPIHLLFSLYIAAVFLLQGASAYKRTSEYESELYVYAPISVRKVYSLKIFEQLSWTILQNISILTAYLLTLIDHFPIIMAISLMITTLALSVLLMTAGNYILSRYYITKIESPVGWTRFIGYMIFFVFFIWLGFALVGLIKKPVTVIREKIVTFEFFTNESYSEAVMRQLLSAVMNPIRKAGSNLLAKQKIIDAWILNPALLIGLSVLCILFLFFLLRFAPAPYLKRQAVQYKDFLSKYGKWLKWLNNATYKNNLLEMEITRLASDRTIVSPKFFLMSFVTYESAFYFGIFSHLLSAGNPDALSFLLYTVLLVLVLTNHAFELREEFPHLFLLGGSKNTLYLYRLAGRSTLDLYKAKKQMMILILAVPALILSFLTAVLSFYHLFFLYGILVLIATMILSSLYQMYAVTFLVKTDYTHQADIGQTEEEEWIIKLQSYPRKILIVPVLYFLYSSIFIDWDSQIFVWAHHLFLIIYALGGTVFFIMARKIAVRNLRKFDKKYVRF